MLHREVTKIWPICQNMPIHFIGLRDCNGLVKFLDLLLVFVRGSTFTKKIAKSKFLVVGSDTLYTGKWSWSGRIGKHKLIGQRDYGDYFQKY